MNEHNEKLGARRSLTDTCAVPETHSAEIPQFWGHASTIPGDFETV